MPNLSTDDGVSLYYEEAGGGAPIVFVHEFAGDHRSWEPQVRYFSRHYRRIAFNALGWPPSEVPQDVARYSQAHAGDDIRSVLDGLEIDTAHIVDLSMGGLATLHLGLPRTLAAGFRGRLRLRAERVGEVSPRGDGHRRQAGEGGHGRLCRGLCLRPAPWRNSPIP